MPVPTCSGTLQVDMRKRAEPKESGLARQLLKWGLPGWEHGPLRMLTVGLFEVVRRAPRQLKELKHIAQRTEGLGVPSTEASHGLGLSSHPLFLAL